MLCVANDHLKRSRIHRFVQILRHFRLSRPDDTSLRASYTPILFPSRRRLFLPVEFCNALVLTSAGRLTAVHLIDASEGCLPAGELGYWSHRLRQRAPSEKAPVKIPVVTMLLMFMDTPTFFFERSDHQSFPGGSAPSLIAKRDANIAYLWWPPSIERRSAVEDVLMLALSLRSIVKHISLIASSLIVSASLATWQNAIARWETGSS